MLRHAQHDNWAKRDVALSEAEGWFDKLGITSRRKGLDKLGMTNRTLSP